MTVLPSPRPTSGLPALRPAGRWPTKDVPALGAVNDGRVDLATNCESPTDDAATATPEDVLALEPANGACIDLDTNCESPTDDAETAMSLCCSCDHLNAMRRAKHEYVFARTHISRRPHCCLNRIITTINSHVQFYRVDDSMRFYLFPCCSEVLQILAIFCRMMPFSPCIIFV